MILKKFLFPGEYAITGENMSLSTVLGSCVSCCIKNSKNRQSAITHTVHPNQPDPPTKPIGFYADAGLRHVIEEMFKADSNPANYNVQVFGGSNSFKNIDIQFRMGRKNLESTYSVLDEYGLAITHRQVGGVSGMKITFDTFLNHVHVEMGQALIEKPNSNIRLLIVDDSPSMRKIFAKILDGVPELEICGEASNAHEARDMIVRLSPDVVFLDILMPGIDGMSLLQKVMIYKPLPIILISSEFEKNPALKAEAFAKGAVGAINKSSISIAGGLEQSRALLMAEIHNAIHHR